LGGLLAPGVIIFRLLAGNLSVAIYRLAARNFILTCFLPVVIVQVIQDRSYLHGFMLFTTEKLRTLWLLWFGFIIPTVLLLARGLQNIIRGLLENIARLVRVTFAVQRCGAFGVIVFFYFIEVVFEFIFFPLTIFVG
jgi:hypothetical protein